MQSQQASVASSSSEQQRPAWERPPWHSSTGVVGTAGCHGFRPARFPARDDDLKSLVGLQTNESRASSDAGRTAANVVPPAAWHHTACSGDQDLKSLLCLQNCRGISADAMSLLGLRKQEGEAGEDQMVCYTRGYCFRCPCGKFPPAGGLVDGPKVWPAAVKHWPECQGCMPPKQTKQQRKAILQLVVKAIREKRMSKTFQSYEAWRKAIKGNLKEAFCVLDYDTMESRCRKYATHTFYLCTRCGRHPGSFSMQVAALPYAPRKHLSAGHLTKSTWEREAC